VIAILDVTAAAKIVLQEDEGLKFQQALDASDSVYTPDLFVPELTNTMRKYYKRKLLTIDECKRDIEQGIRLVDVFIDSKLLWKKAFDLGIKHDHAIYDMYYVAMAKENMGTILTCDMALVQICDKEKIGVVF
jgi:predicted nucleic acid-binding protein